MTKQIIPFTDSDGDIFIISDIRIDDLDGVPAVFLTVNMNGKATETLEWLNAFDDGSTAVESHLWVNHRREFGEEAYDYVWDCLASWLDANRQVAA